MPPLTVDQLNPRLMVTLAGQPRRSERAIYDALTTDDDRRRYLHTRGFLRWCRDVKSRAVGPLQLPQLPDRVNWNRAFLEPQSEAIETVDVALGMRMDARFAD